MSPYHSFPLSSNHSLSLSPHLFLSFSLSFSLFVSLSLSIFTLYHSLTIHFSLPLSLLYALSFLHVLFEATSACNTPSTMRRLCNAIRKPVVTAPRFPIHNSCYIAKDVYRVGNIRPPPLLDVAAMRCGKGAAMHVQYLPSA